MRWPAGIPLVLLVLLADCGAGPVSLGDPTVWTAHPADGVALELSDEGGALRLDFAFTGGGYAIARREVDLDIPANYTFRFNLRGEAIVMRNDPGIMPPAGGLLLAPPTEGLTATIDGALASPDAIGRVRVMGGPVVVRWGP